jgi:ribose 5-phosphate isomerase B
MSRSSHSGPPPTIPPRELVRQVVREVAAEVLSESVPSTPGWSLPSRYVAPAAQIAQQARRAAPVSSEPARRVMRPSPKGVHVAIGSDHGGYDLKRRLCELLRERGFIPVDVGTHDHSSCDYPDYARKVGEAVRGGKAALGIMIDGAGIGSAMVLNKMRGIRAATVHSEATAVNSRAHNDANVLVLGSAQMHAGHARRVTRIWLETAHEGGRHARRVDMINLLDQGRP